ncbi:MAG: YciI family protein [Actinomycetales bacterium]
MQYLVSVLHDSTDLATTDEMAAIDEFNDRLMADGHWVFAGGLGGPETATVIDNRGGQQVVMDGPYVESKEYLAGFWVLEAPDLDVALKLAAEGSRACNRRVEVRPFLGAASE